MEVDRKMVRELQKKFELETNKREIEITEGWKKELETIYTKKYESLSALRSDMKMLIERMANRATILTRMIKEEQ